LAGFALPLALLALARGVAVFRVLAERFGLVERFGLRLLTPSRECRMMGLRFLLVAFFDAGRLRFFMVVPPKLRS
jgi:hypothetical protein